MIAEKKIKENWERMMRYNLLFVSLAATCYALEAPTLFINVSHTRFDSVDVNLIWSPVVGAHKYDIYSDSIKIAATNGTSFNLTTATEWGFETPNIAKRYHVIAKQHRYEVVDQAMSWPSAKTYAESIGGHLVTIESQEENDLVLSMRGNTNIWLGASDAIADGFWLWVDGTPWNYTNWHNGEPNGGTGEFYLEMYESGAWNDKFSIASNRFVVEWDQ